MNSKLTWLAQRLALLAIGVAVLHGVLYVGGIYLVPLVDPLDKAITAAMNPDAYVPGVDEFFRAVSDYSNFWLSVPLIFWAIAYGLYRLFRGGRQVFVAILAVLAVLMAGLAIAGKIWPNPELAGANVLLVVGTLMTFGAAAWAMHSLSEDGLRRLAGLFSLVLITVLLTHFAGSAPLKKSVARPRPLNDVHKPWNEQLRSIPDEVVRGFNSYPSGHTSGTFSLITPFFWFARDRRVRGGILAWGVLQGVSRVYTVAHFPFCCIAGGLLGFGIGTMVFFLFGGPSLRPPLENPEQAAATA